MALNRTLGLWDVFALAAGVMISSGLFVLPGVAFSYAGPAVIICYALAGIMAIPAMLGQAELATAMPKAGGTYFFVERSLGALPGLIAGLANWFAIAMKSAFALIGIGAFVNVINESIPSWAVKLITVILCLVFSSINCLSVKVVKKFQAVAVMVVSIVLLLCCGYAMFSHSSSVENFSNFTSKGWSAIFATAGMVFISYGGLTKIASVAEEVRDPSRNIPLGMILALLLVTGLYVLVVFFVVGVSDLAVLPNSLTPLSDAGRAAAGPTGKIVLSACALLALVSAANGGILAASRNPMAMSRDGLLPEFLSKVSKRFGTPVFGVIVTAAFMVTALTLLEVATLVKTASLMMLGLFLLVNISVLIMRSSGMQNYRPGFRCPLYPWMQIAGLIIYISLIAVMCVQMITAGGKKIKPLEIMAGFIAISLVWYFLYIRRRVQRESAFMRMVKNVIDKRMERGALDDELRQIALERDDVVHDEFDQLVEKSPAIDIEGHVVMDAVFHRAAKILAPMLGYDEDEIYQKLADRERETSTVIQAGLAIPHFITDGEDQFEMLLIRAKDGVLFPKQDAPVTAIFVLAGSNDQRNKHLRALMAIAHTVQEPDFFERWLTAVDPEHLRDIFLLSGRQRHHH